MKTPSTGKAWSCLIAAGLATMSPTARAVDGVVLIDQNKALAGNVTPGDAPGFPITITQLGSYRLDGNLTVPFGGTAIAIAVPDVTIDLNGFSILGTAPTQTAGGQAVRFTGSPPALGITVRNGTISGFVSPFALGFTISASFQTLNAAAATLQDLFLDSGIPGLTASLDLGPHSRVVNVSGAGLSLNIGCPSVVAYSVFTILSPSSNRCAVTGNATAF